MTRLTGTDALGLMEAYNAVYTQEELTEEQIQEDFKNWVYSLVEEGHDLSEYTWEEMYEAYNEGSQNRDALSMDRNWSNNIVGPKIVGPKIVGSGKVGPKIVGPKIVGPPNRGYDAIPGVRSIRTWASDNARAERQDALNRQYTPRLKENFDQYDLILGHLLDEGYADTEEDALVIMSNMSEEWKQTIIESF